MFFLFSFSKWFSMLSRLIFSAVLLLHPQWGASPHSFPGDSFPSSCHFLHFFLLICLLHASDYFPLLHQRRVQAKTKSKCEATTFLRCSTVLSMEACHFWWKVPTGITAIPVVFDKDVMLLRQPLLIVFWDAEQTRRFFLGCVKVTLSWWNRTQVSATASEALEKNRWGSPECRNMSIMYKTQSILPLQPSKIMCTTQLSYRTKTTTMPETLMLF